MPKRGAWTSRLADSRVGGGVFEGGDTPMVTTGKAGGWGILRNRGDLSNWEDDFETGELISLYGLSLLIE